MHSEKTKLGQLLDEIESYKPKDEEKVKDILEEGFDALERSKRERIVKKVGKSRTLIIPRNADIKEGDYVLIKKIEVDSGDETNKKTLQKITKHLEDLTACMVEIRNEVMPDVEPS